MSNYPASKHDALHSGERFANMEYMFLTHLLSQSILSYDNCYQIHPPSPTVDNSNNIWDEIPELEDADGNIVPSHYRRPKERARPFAKL
ncbi:hypothetical protein C8R43DRAFT_1125396 [Mycena crocata]|nr:hypothetical protein C8R43DRAFT_1125396 [Mycena crocata]